VILGRRTAEPAAGGEPEIEAAAEPAGKGRPTPKRSEARKARRNVTPRNRKEAAALTREKGREQRRLARQALISGDERHLPARDAGPERRLARDVIDSRFTLGQVFFAAIFVAFALSLVQNPALRVVSNFAALLALLGMVVDSARNGRKAKNAVIERFGASEARGISSYAFMRSFLPRRFRRPPPKVKRGDPLR
jgi:Protein of unknown function (DUF3043)